MGSEVARMRRVAIVGHSCTGKSTLARALAGRLGHPRLELDAVHWLPGWTPQAAEPFRERVSDFVSGPNWIVDGNYSRVQDLVFARADTVVWLDFPLPLVFARLIRRSVRRSLIREELWNGNRETLRHALFSWDGLPLWILRTHAKKNRRYVEAMDDPDLHARWVRLRSPRELEIWLASIGVESRGSRAP